jgi:hypothetical protein
MAIPERMPWVETKILPELGDLHPEICLDAKHRGLWWNAKRAWTRGHVLGGTHHLVLQDDILLCDDFVATAERALAALDARGLEVPVTFYANRKICEEVSVAGGRWAKIGDGCWGQALCMPTSAIHDFLSWERKSIVPEFRWDDSRWSIWCVERGRPAWATVPSLVEHVGSEHSSVGNPKNTGRRARVLDLKGAHLLDWSAGIDEAPHSSGSGVLSQYSKWIIPKEERRP